MTIYSGFPQWKQRKANNLDTNVAILFLCFWLSECTAEVWPMNKEEAEGLSKKKPPKTIKN